MCVCFGLGNCQGIEIGVCVCVYVCVCVCVFWFGELSRDCDKGVSVCVSVYVCVLRNSVAAGKKVKEEEVGSKCIGEVVVGTQSD